MHEYTSIVLSEIEAAAIVESTQRLPPIDSGSPENAEFGKLARLQVESSPGTAALCLRVLARLAEQGFVVINLDALASLVDLTLNRTAITAVLATIGEPIQVFESWPLWKPIFSNTDLEPWRAGGIGHIPLHMDFVNAAAPPDYTCFFCLQPDPLGGGNSIVARTSAAAELLSPDHIILLRRRVFSDGQVVRLRHVGDDINPFAVLNLNSAWPIRFTGKMLYHLPESPAKEALKSFGGHLRSIQSCFPLRRFELLVIDQRIAVHGREPLAPGQECVPKSDRRLLHQMFLRSHS
jgi:hypothetical protein